MTFVEPAAAMYRWLQSNNIPVEGFRLVLSFPDAAAKARAEQTISREMDAFMRFAADAPRCGELKQFEMHGIDTRLESRVDR